MKLLFANKKLQLMLCIVVLLFAACELIDPTKVENPSITQEKLFADATGGAQPLITGLEFAYADAVNRAVYFLEVVSDDYVNTSTYISTQLDNPRLITPNDQYLGDAREIYFKLEALHALANFGLSTVLPKDEQSTEADKSAVLFFRAMSVIMLCENFQAFPLEEDGQMVRSEDAIKIAIEDLNTAYGLFSGGEHAIDIKLALARANRLDGNKAAAVQAANEALAMSTNYVYFAAYDATNLPNLTTGFTVVRPQQDMQPLPRLDFLDPKYSNPDQADPIPTLKSEEAYLILAEAALSDGNSSDAKKYMVDAITLADSRNTVEFTDNDKRRNRPNNSTYKVKADANAPEESGLIFARSGSSVTTHPVSGTSLTADFVNAISNNDDLFHALYLLRQEIFFTEGRRMSDLGIRLPVMGRQIDANPNVNAGDYGTVVFVPSYIPQSNEMDQFSINDASGVVTILYDMNKVLTQNKSLVSPFF